MINRKFDGILTKYTNIPPAGDNQPCVQLVIKHTNVGDIQSFMSYFEQAIETKNFQNVFAYPVMWSKMVFDVSDYRPNYYLIEFAEIEFNAKLQKIEVSKKNVEGIDSFEYNLHFKKEITTADGTNAYTYLKYKEEDENGKKVLVEFPVLINIADEPQDTTANSDIL